MISQVVKQVNNFFHMTFNKSPKIIGVKKVENGWLAKVEIIEESEYMRSRALDDIIGIYEVELDQSINVVGYSRISLRERDKIEENTDDD